MDTSEMKSLEEKARAIVATLTELESETNRQRKMGDQLEQSKEAIFSLASRLSDTADRLADAITLLQQSTLAEDIDRLDSKTDSVRDLANLAAQEAERAERLCDTTVSLASRVEDSCRQVDDRLNGVQVMCVDLLKAVESLAEESTQRNAELTQRLDNLEEVIGRIDRNTQKGFGKERPKHAAW